MREPGRDVHRFLITQSTLTQGKAFVKADRHVAFDERRSGVGAGHAGANVEGLLAPERRKYRAAILTAQALAVDSMTHRALLDVHLLAIGKVGLDRRIDFANTASSYFVAGLGVVLHPLEVGDHGLHVGRLRWNRLAVHGTTETAVDAFF
ncbi:hypothetical protein D3C77_432670 [compost metagenome]